MNLNLLRPGRLLPVPPDSTVAYIIMQFCHFCGMQSFVSGLLFVSIRLFYSRHTKLPGRKCARPCRRRRPRPALAVVAVVRCRRDVVVPALAVVAVPAGGARRGHVPRARRRRCCGPLLRRGRTRRWRPPRPRLHRHCRRRNSTAGNLPKAYQIMHNDATWKMNRYL